MLNFIVSKDYYPIDSERIEKKYNAKYIGDFCLKQSNGYTDFPVAIYYQPNPDIEKGHKEYFGLFLRDDRMYITDGTKAFLEPFIAVKDENNVYISCYRHHFNSNEDNSVFIDGGRDYTRYTLDNELVEVIVEKGEFKIIKIKYESKN